MFIFALQTAELTLKLWHTLSSLTVHENAKKPHQLHQRCLHATVNLSGLGQLGYSCWCLSKSNIMHWAIFLLSSSLLLTLTHSDLDESSFRLKKREQLHDFYFAKHSILRYSRVGFKYLRFNDKVFQTKLVKYRFNNSIKKLLTVFFKISKTNLCKRLWW